MDGDPLLDATDGHVHLFVDRYGFDALREQAGQYQRKQQNEISEHDYPRPSALLDTIVRDATPQIHWWDDCADFPGNIKAGKKVLALPRGIEPLFQP